MAISVRSRFEVFKRDQFTCQYCGKRSPEVVLEVDHIVPVSEGGGDTVVNLLTSCWACNSGKSNIPLGTILTGEDPHDKSVEILERERQLREYNNVLADERTRREADAWDLVVYWKQETGTYRAKESLTHNRRDLRWLLHTLTYCPKEVIRRFMDVAIDRDAIATFQYVGGCVRHWREQHLTAPEPIDDTVQSIEIGARAMYSTPFDRDVLHGYLCDAVPPDELWLLAGTPGKLAPFFQG